MYRSEQRWPMVCKPLPSHVQPGFLCSLSESVWLITRREPACWIINFSSPSPYFFFFLCTHSWCFSFCLFSFCLWPSLSMPPFLSSGPPFLPMELTTSISHWRLATQPRAGWLHTWGEFISSRWGFCLWKQERERERAREWTAGSLSPAVF